MNRFVVAVAAFVLVATAAGQSFEKRVWVPDSMYDIRASNLYLYNPTTQQLLFANGQRGNLQMFDPVTNTKSGIIRDLFLAASLVHAPPPGRIYATLFELDQVAVLDDNTGQVIDRIDWIAEPYGAAYNSVLGKVYVGSREDGLLYVLDPGPDTVITTVAAGDEVSVFVFDSLSNRLFAMTEGEGITTFDGTADTVVARLPALDCNYDIAADFSLRKLFCMGMSNHPERVQVNVYDMDSLELLAELTIPDGWCPDLGRILVNPTSHYAYAAYYETFHGFGGYEDSVAVVDCQADSFAGFVVLPRAVYGWGVDPVHDKVYIGGYRSDSVAVLAVPDSITSWVIFPDAVAGFAFAPVNNKLYCPCDNNYLYVLDPASDSIIGEVDYSLFTPMALTWNAAGNKLYASNFGGIAALGPDDSMIARTRVGWNGFFGPHGYSAQLNRFYLAASNQPYLFVYDCNQDSILYRRDLTYSAYYPGTALDDYHRLFLPSFDGRMLVYDTYLDSVVATVDDVGQHLVYSTRTDRLYGYSHEQDGIRVVNPATAAIVAEIPIPFVRDLVVNTADNELYVPSGAAYTTVHVVDAATNTATDSFEVPKREPALYWVNEWNQLFAVADTAVYVYDCPARQVNRSLAVPSGRSQGVFQWNPRNDRLYLARERATVALQLPMDTIVASFPYRHEYDGLAWGAVDNRVYIAGSDHIVVLAEELSITAGSNAAPTAARLEVNGNPAAGPVCFSIALPSGKTARLGIYDATGRLRWQRTVRGSSMVTWNRTDMHGRALAGGVYLYMLESGSVRTSGKVVLTASP